MLLGKQGIDDDNNQTGQMVWPRCGIVRRLRSLRRSSSRATRRKVTREVDAGLETIEVDLPAVSPAPTCA